MSDRPAELQNIREFLGFLVGRRVIDITAGDPPGLPDADPDDDGYITFHFDNGSYARLWVDADIGFCFFNADDAEEDEDDGEDTADEAP